MDHPHLPPNALPPKNRRNGRFLQSVLCLTVKSSEETKQVDAPKSGRRACFTWPLKRRQLIFVAGVLTALVAFILFTFISKQKARTAFFEMKYQPKTEHKFEIVASIDAGRAWNFTKQVIPLASGDYVAIGTKRNQKLGTKDALMRILMKDGVSSRFMTFPGKPGWSSEFNSVSQISGGDLILVHCESKTNFDSVSKLIRLTSSGDMVFEKLLTEIMPEAEAGNYIEALLPVDDGIILVAVRRKRFEEPHPVVIKIDRAGNRLWQTSFEYTAPNLRKDYGKARVMKLNDSIVLVVPYPSDAVTQVLMMNKFGECTFDKKVPGVFAESFGPLPEKKALAIFGADSFNYFSASPILAITIADQPPYLSTYRGGAVKGHPDKSFIVGESVFMVTDVGMGSEALLTEFDLKLNRKSEGAVRDGSVGQAGRVLSMDIFLGLDGGICCHRDRPYGDKKCPQGYFFEILKSTKTQLN